MLFLFMLYIFKKKILAFENHKIRRGDLDTTRAFLADMPETQTVKLYVLGPPLKSISTLGVFVQDVLQGFSDTDLQSFQVRQFQGPLTYHVNFAKTPFTKTPKQGQGMYGLHLWALQCTWWGHPLPDESFSVVVKDSDFFGMTPENRPYDAELQFATFTISCPKDGEVKPGNVYELFTTK